MNQLLPIYWIIVSLAPCQGVIAAASDNQLPPEARVLDAHLAIKKRPHPTISPDGKWVAYVSDGQVTVCNVEAPLPRRLMKMPESFDSTKSRWSDLVWTRLSDGFACGIESWDEKTRTAYGIGYLATVEGKVTRLSRIEPNAPTRGLIVGHLTDDRRFLVGKSMLSTGTRRWGPLIWDIERNRPRATPYLHLVPSTTSGRSIGIERDTRQLVLLDEGLEVTQRFDEQLPDRTFGFQLDWSPDERFVLWRNQIGFDHYSNWEGFRLDLKTRARRALEGRFMREQLAFTGNGGELVRFGQDGVRSKHWTADIITDAHLTIVPEGFGPPRNVWRIELGVGQRLGEWTPPLHVNSGAKLFVIALPQFSDHRNLYRWHLMDRTGKAWRFPGAESDPNSSVAPYDVAGFALEGEQIVGYDATRIFTVRVASILKEANEAR